MCLPIVLLFTSPGPLAPFAALPTERCLALTAPEARRRFSTTDELEREVVLVSDTLGPQTLGPADAKALGLALHANVELVGERWRFVRPSAVRDALRKADAEWLQTQAQATVARVRAVAGAFDESPSKGAIEVLKRAQARFETQKPNAVDDSGTQALEVAPAGRLLAAILERAPKELWTEATPGEVTAFSNRPVGAEIPLRIDPVAFKTYLADQERFSDWAQNAAPGEVAEKYRWVLPTGAVRLGDRTVLLNVMRNDPVPAFNLAVYDREGNAESHTLLTPMGSTAVTPPKAGSLGSAVVSPGTLAALADAVPESPTFRSERLDPDAHDPLDALVREALVRYARAKGFETVVACVPDDLLRSTERCRDGAKIDLDAFARALSASDCEEIPNGKTLVVRPAHPLQEEALRSDRRPLAEAYRRAAAGTFGIDALLALHAGYAEEYDRPFLFDTVETIRRAFRLSDSPNWSLPHAVLALLGDLSPAERGSLSPDVPFRVDPAKHARSLRAMARLASRQGSRSALAKRITRVLAEPGGLTLTGSAGLRTLVARVSRGPTIVTRIDGNTRVATTERVEHLRLDDDFRPLDARLLDPSSIPTEGLFKDLDKRYRFLWSQERHLAVEPVFGGVDLGTFVLREPPLRRSKEAVPLSEVPGVDFRP